ncbi:MAG: DUF4410 domain-containing protein [Acidobacteria bacterium]|nr:DUF4410 domain-containing protein [Acidobacteriota bacterium]
MRGKRTWWLTAVGLAVALCVPAWAGDDSADDEGLLDPEYFGDGVSFKEHEWADFGWMHEDFKLPAGRVTFHVDVWDDPVMLAKSKRDAKDFAKANELSELMPARLRGALQVATDGLAQVSRKDGNILVTGRIVDCNYGSKTAKMLIGFGAGASSVTFDVKISEAKSGKLLVAVHHRVISGTEFSDIEGKLIKWMEVFAAELREHLVESAIAPAE